MSSAILELVSIQKQFDQIGLDTVQVFSNVNFSLFKGEIVGLFSPSGAGKTTLLQIAGLLDSPTSGQILIDGQDTNSLSDTEKTELTRKGRAATLRAHSCAKQREYALHTSV